MDKKELFRIGEVAKLFHISVSTLRHYENEGILHPEYIDENSGYRYYSTRQFECLNTIRYLRVLGTPLNQIAEFLANRNLDSIQALLEKQKNEISNKITELETIKKKINNRLNQLNDAISSTLDKIEIINVPPRKIAWIRHSISLKSYLDLEVSIRELEAKETDAFVFLGKVGVGISEEHMKSEQFKTYDRVFLILDSEDNFSGKITELPSNTSVRIRYRGSHNEAEKQYKKLIEFIKVNNLRICGFSSEITMIDYGYTDDTSKFVTEIQIPVKCIDDNSNAF